MGIGMEDLRGGMLGFLPKGKDRMRRWGMRSEKGESEWE